MQTRKPCRNERQPDRLRLPRRREQPTGRIRCFALQEPRLGKLFLLFAILPLVDLYVLLQIGERIGGVPALAMVVLAGALGAALARTEGTRMLRAWQHALAAGTVPQEGVVSGVLVFVGSALLSRRVISDALGLLLLVPFTRRPIARWLAARVQRAIERGTIHAAQAQPGMSGPFGAGAHAGRSPIPRTGHRRRRRDCRAASARDQATRLGA